MSWYRYVGMRLVASLLLVGGVLTGVYALSVVLIPGDFATVYRLSLTAEELDAFRDELGLDRPWWSQFGDWIWGVVRGDLGTSFSGFDVSDFLARVLPFTLLILVLAVTVAFVVGVVVGRAVGWSPNRRADAGMVGMSALATLFPPWLTFLLAFGVAEAAGFSTFTRLRLLDSQLWAADGPRAEDVAWAMLAGLGVTVAVYTTTALAANRLSATRKIRRSVRRLAAAAGLTAGAVLVLQVAGSARIVDLVGLLGLPLIAVALTNVADTALLVATVTAGSRTAPFVFTARAKGLPEHTIIRHHVGRATLLPILSRYVANLPLVLGGLVIIEYAFRTNGPDFVVPVPGLSTTLFGALGTNDIPLALGALLVLAMITITARLALDIAQAALDPRYRDGTVPL